MKTIFLFLVLSGFLFQLNGQSTNYANIIEKNADPEHYNVKADLLGLDTIIEYVTYMGNEGRNHSILLNKQCYKSGMLVEKQFQFHNENKSYAYFTYEYDNYGRLLKAEAHNLYAPAIGHELCGVTPNESTYYNDIGDLVKIERKLKDGTVYETQEYAYVEFSYHKDGIDIPVAMPAEVVVKTNGLVNRIYHFGYRSE